MLQNNCCLRLGEDSFVDIVLLHASCTFLKELVLHYQQLDNSFGGLLSGSVISVFVYVTKGQERPSKVQK